jgi:hypothetical protein
MPSKFDKWVDNQPRKGTIEKKDEINEYKKKKYKKKGKDKKKSVPVSPALYH